MRSFPSPNQPIRVALASACLALVASLLLMTGVQARGAELPRAAHRANVLKGNPPSNCLVADPFLQTLRHIDTCRAREGVGPLTLPRNWSRLTPAEQLLVVIDLERVNRGLPPIVGLSPALSRLARIGVQRGTDPPFPTSGFTGGGGISAGVQTVLAADFGWMYSDGFGGHPLFQNVECTSEHAPGCWGHRDNILLPGSGLVGGGAGRVGDYAFEMLDGYHAGPLSFTWRHELAYFARRPGYEPL